MQWEANVLVTKQGVKLAPGPLYTPRAKRPLHVNYALRYMFKFSSSSNIGNPTKCQKCRLTLPKSSQVFNHYGQALRILIIHHRTIFLPSPKKSSSRCPRWYKNLRIMRNPPMRTRKTTTQLIPPRTAAQTRGGIHTPRGHVCAIAKFHPSD